ncbi:cytochrome P450 [Glomus cerebriforme]|uniref:Cytochrome P450 n=1 Tax=Glomus cerebriforme TaxID=658196 RepID=A0A397TEI2_9GLOM|nr:cytochrome P450 [Glomus cerebriforme]
MMSLKSLSVLSEVSATNYLLLFVIGLVTYIVLFYYRYFTRTNPLPGPLPLPIVGNLLQYPGDAGKWVKQLRQTYGDMFEIYLGSAKAVCLCRADLAGKLMTSSPIRTPPNDGLDELGVSNKGILVNRNHDDWSYNRRFLQKTTASPKGAREAIESTQVLFNEMEELWKRLDDDENEIDFAGWISQFTFENILLLTTKLRSYALTNYYNTKNPHNKVVEPKGTISESESFVKSLRTQFNAVCFFLLTPKILRNSETSKQFLNNKAWITTNLLKIIKDRRAQIESSEEKIDSQDLLTQLLTVNTDKDVTRNIVDDKHTKKMSDDDVRANLMDPLVGGTVTTATTLCAIVYYLAHHPEVQKRMVQELDNVLGKDRDSHITFEQVDKLEYTDAVFKEVSRLFPVIPVNVRTNLEPDEIAGYTFPPNTQFMIDIEGIHCSPNYWSDPDTFNPDRWLSTTSDKKRAKNTYFQFGGGARMCPGMKLALAEVKTFMALLYRKYDVELVDNESPLHYKYALIKICEELRVKIKPRN